MLHAPCCSGGDESGGQCAGRGGRGGTAARAGGAAGRRRRCRRRGAPRGHCVCCPALTVPALRQHSLTATLELCPGVPPVFVLVIVAVSGSPASREMWGDYERCRMLQFWAHTSNPERNEGTGKEVVCNEGASASLSQVETSAQLSPGWSCQWQPSTSASRPQCPQGSSPLPQHKKGLDTGRSRPQST